MPEQSYLARRAPKNDHVHKFPDLTGTVFGRLTVVSFSSRRDSRYQRFWECRCSCGAVKTFRESHLRNGLSTSCGNWAAHATERFWEKVNKNGPMIREDLGACWIWTAKVNNHGYGECNAYGTSFLAHRFSWKLENGEIPDGLQVLHKCDNPPCIRPDHRFLGSQKDNILDCLQKKRMRVPTFSGPGELNPSAKLTAEDVRYIRSGAETSKELAMRFGVDYAHIRAIRKGRVWKNV